LNLCELSWRDGERGWSVGLAALTAVRRGSDSRESSRHSFGGRIWRYELFLLFRSFTSCLIQKCSLCIDRVLLRLKVTAESCELRSSYLAHIYVVVCVLMNHACILMIQTEQRCWKIPRNAPASACTRWMSCHHHLCFQQRKRVPVCGGRFQWRTFRKSDLISLSRQNSSQVNFLRVWIISRKTI
jgi:hypothetical protein